MSISIVIPTTASRNSIFKTLDSIFESKLNLDLRVEVVVNRLGNNLSVLNQLYSDTRIKLRFHSEVYDSAEASAMWAAYTSKSDWVWIIGDDDLATPGSIQHVAALINQKDVNFWLLNTLLVFSDLPLEYYRIGPKPVQVSTAYKLWEKCGFFSVLTTLSCFLIKRSVIDIDLFEEFHKIQGVYSHTFSLLAMLNDSQVGVSDFFCVIRNEESSESISSSLSRYTEVRNVDLNSIWTNGALDLFKLLARKIDVPISSLLMFREIEIVKDSLNSNEKSSDLRLLVSSSQSVMNRFKKSSGTSHEKITEDLVFTAPVRITLEL